MFLTKLHRSVLIVSIFFCSCLFAQRNLQFIKDLNFKRQAFNHVDHFYIGAHIGAALPLIFVQETNMTGTSNTKAYYAFSFSFSIPQHRLFAGYKWKRHSFEITAESKSYNTDFDIYNPGGMPYVRTFRGYYVAVGYNIDLLYNQPLFKIQGGGNLGAYFLMKDEDVALQATPAVGINGMFELQCTHNFSLFFDTRYTIGFLKFDESGVYGGLQVNYRLMSLDFDLGFKINIYSKTRYQLGMDNFEASRSKN